MHHRAAPSAAKAAAISASLLVLIAGFVLAGSTDPAPVYKYRDANGNLVYAEQKPGAKTDVETIAITLESKAPRIAVDKVGNAEHWELRAVNECLCVVEFDVHLLETHNLNITGTPSYHRALQPQSQQSLVQLSHEGVSAPSLQYSWKAILGLPGAQHVARQPYRAPFAVGASYLISQAYPNRFTHNSPDAQYAVDIALPDGTPVYAAREGLVINLRHDSFRGAATAVMMDQANMVEILHDDGTIAIYAHLHWDSVRVQPGQHVLRGEYIADSGNTGFSTGAHLHFAVLRNAGLEAVSVPIQFGGPGATAITPQQNMMLTAY
jgi:murein DD-endopeptidase MepM/ murein hydrolase activator NlpD